MSSQIIFLRRSEIDDDKWNSCIDNSDNASAYSQSWFLDSICNNWGGLVFKEYEAVLAVPIKRKYGLTYMYHPLFCQQLGIQSQMPLSTELKNLFFKQIPYFYRFIQINASNAPNILANRVELPNYELTLNKEYSALFKSFSNNTKRNIKKSLNSGLNTTKISNSSTFLSFYKKHSKAQLGNSDYQTLINLISKTLQLKKGFIIQCNNNEGEIVSMVFFIKTNEKIYYHSSVSSNEGMQKKASFLIMDEIIQTYSDSCYTIDFEGSQIEGIARFFKGFGATLAPYIQLQRSFDLKNIRNLIIQSFLYFNIRNLIK